MCFWLHFVSIERLSFIDFFPLLSPRPSPPLRSGHVALGNRRHSLASGFTSREEFFLSRPRDVIELIPVRTVTLSAS